ncbi:hypothetical protein DNTS_016146 [Danionella cerebrum]|uniref:Uncharacterized protein n=1 Tax=Danionella cerebrum TaxID=2873325 RepID=A0A553Q8U7_9TELE|nr:hypothetical protein DNTS_016146 [Danionella translucida]
MSSEDALLSELIGCVFEVNDPKRFHLSACFWNARAPCDDLIGNITFSTDRFQSSSFESITIRSEGFKMPAALLPKLHHTLVSCGEGLWEIMCCLIRGQKGSPDRRVISVLDEIQQMNLQPLRQMQ